MAIIRKAATICARVIRRKPADRPDRIEIVGVERDARGRLVPASEPVVIEVTR